MHQQTTQSSATNPELPKIPILELLLEGKPVAVAVRRQGRASHTEQPSPDSHPCNSDTRQVHNQQEASSHTSNAHSATHAQKQGEPWTCFYAMDGTVLATEQEGNLYKGGGTGRHTHTVLTGQTPLVRHMHIVSNAEGEAYCRCSEGIICVMPHGAMLYCAMPHGAMLYCAMLYSAMLRLAVLGCAASSCALMCFVAASGCSSLCCALHVTVGHCCHAKSLF